MHAPATALVTLALALAVAPACVTMLGDSVPFEPTPMSVVREMLELAAVGPSDVLYDLGSGDGRIAIAAAKDFGARAVGIEIDSGLVARAQQAARDAGVSHKVEFRVADMYTADIRPATVVTLFLNPRPNIKLRPKLRSQLQPSSRVLSYMWDMGDWAPQEVREVGGRPIYLWRIAAANAPAPFD